MVGADDGYVFWSHFNGVFVENEEERGKIRSRMSHLEKEKRMDAMTQIENARKSSAARTAHPSTRNKVDTMTFKDPLFDLSNEWSSRKEEMAETRKKIALSQQAKAEKLVKQVESLAESDDASQHPAPPKEAYSLETAAKQSAAHTSITSDGQMGDLKLIDLTAIVAPPSEPSPTKSVSFRFDNSSGEL